MNRITTHVELVANIFRFGFTLSILCGTYSSGLAAIANSSDIDAKIAARFQRIRKLYEASGDNRALALQAASKALEDCLVHAPSPSALMTNPLKESASLGLMIASSKDKNVRIFSWDKGTGGTMLFYDAVVLYNDQGKFHCRHFGATESDDCGKMYHSIRTIHTDSGTTVYLVANGGTYSGISYALGMESYAIKNGRFEKIKLFHTKKQDLDSIVLAIESTDHKELTDFVFTDQDRTMKVPLVDEHSHLTNKYLVYKFDGAKFIYSGVGR